MKCPAHTGDVKIDDDDAAYSTAYIWVHWK